MFCENLGVESAIGMRELITRAQRYINYEEKLIEKDVEA